ncbi:hypothetical protein TSOC_005665, partial [Tetrabaena socialis]
MLARTCAPLRPSGVAAIRGVRAAVRPVPAMRLAPVRASATEAKKKEADAAAVEEEYDGPEVMPSTQQVAALLNTLCNETEIAEMHVKVGGGVRVG